MLPGHPFSSTLLLGDWLFLREQIKYMPTPAGSGLGFVSVFLCVEGALRGRGSGFLGTRVLFLDGF